MFLCSFHETGFLRLLGFEIIKLVTSVEIGILSKTNAKMWLLSFTFSKLISAILRDLNFLKSSIFHKNFLDTKKYGSYLLFVASRKHKDG